MVCAELNCVGSLLPTSRSFAELVDSVCQWSRNFAWCSAFRLSGHPAGNAMSKFIAVARHVIWMPLGAVAMIAFNKGSDPGVAHAAMGALMGWVVARDLNRPRQR